MSLRSGSHSPEKLLHPLLPARVKSLRGWRMAVPAPEYPSKLHQFAIINANMHVAVEVILFKNITGEPKIFRRILGK